MEYEAVIGLEVHAQLLTDSKAFCSCSTLFGAEPNANTCPICLGMPGVLPVLNRKALEFTVRMATACDCKIRRISRFARKNYYYPDLPKNYQISQYELPVAEGGWVYVETAPGEGRRINLTRIHMEEDAGKLIHDDNKPVSYVDLNRAGVPLIEIVSEPDIRSPEEAAAYLRTVRSILVCLKVCDGNMEQGSFRCDANVSLRPRGETYLGVKTEVKNMNSFRNVQRALQYEIERQTEMLQNGERIIQDTRLFDPSTGTTASMRSKEQAHDYRYFPDPDLLPLRVEPELEERMRKELPELPAEQQKRFVRELDIPVYDAAVLTASGIVADKFELVWKPYKEKYSGQPKTVSNFMMTNMIEGGELKHPDVDPNKVADLLGSIGTTISGTMAKQVYQEMATSGKDPYIIIKEQGLEQVSDADEVLRLIRQVLDSNAGELEKFFAGKAKIRGFFVGQVMKMSKGKANPALLNQILDEELDRRRTEKT